MQNGKLYAKLTRSFLRKWCKYPYIINIILFSAKLVTILIVVGQPMSFKDLIVRINVRFEATNLSG